jgi:uncharacterized protein (TIGR00255 family)
MADISRPFAGSQNRARSMTGYAAVRKTTSAGELTVSLRSVNGRGLDLHFHGNSEFAAYENIARNLIKQQVNRGHIDVRISLICESDGTGGYDRDLLARYVRLFERAREEFGLEGTLNVNSLLSIPGLFEQARGARPPGPAFESEFTEALVECLAELNRFREREGSELLVVIHAEVEALENATSRIMELREEAVSQIKDRLRDRLIALLGDSSISESRLIEEAAFLADRSDIQEEVTRLLVHTGELRRLLSEGGELGKKLDFLLQEMNRETNTILSKTSGIGTVGLTITSCGLAVKANIERIREQALNLE